ncbi:MAG: hypothetical protein ACRD5Z_09540, partial [Bryobacteraceae bacterium]
LEPALFAWETLVVGGLGLALPILAALVVLCLAFPRSRITVVSAFLVGALLGHYLIVPITYLDSPLVFLNRQWWSLGQELSVLIAVGVVCMWARPHV